MSLLNLSLRLALEACVGGNVRVALNVLFIFYSSVAEAVDGSRRSLRSVSLENNLSSATAVSNWSLDYDRLERNLEE